MKNICFVLYNYSVRGGAEHVTTSLANELINDYNVYILSLHMKENEIYTYTLDSRVKVDTLALPQPRLTKQRSMVKKPLIEYFKKNKIDVAVLQGNYCGFLGSVVKN